MERATDEDFKLILNDILDEREYQISRWGTEADRDKNTPNDWVSYIANYATKWQPGEYAPYDRKALKRFRENMIKVATLACSAAVETDRILNSPTHRPDILDRDRDYESAGILPNATQNIPLAIVASILRAKGFEVRFINGPVAMYRDQIINVMAVNWTQDYSIFDQYEGKIIFLYCLVDENMNMLPDHCNDVGAAVKIRFGVL